MSNKKIVSNSQIYFCLITFWLFQSIGCNTDLARINIVGLPMLNKDTFEMNGSQRSNKKIEYYLVENYTGKQKEKMLIDKFVNENKHQGKDSILYYGIVFYKKTEITNLETISKNPRIIQKLENQTDLIFEYLWSNGKLVAKNDYSFERINKSKNDVEIVDIPDSIKQ